MRLGFLGVVALGAFLLGVGPVWAEAQIGEAAPALVAKTRKGEAFDLQALKGKVVLVMFWATWCPACREELPALEAIWRKFHSQGLEVLAVNVDRPRMRAQVDQVMGYFSFPVAMTEAVSKNELGSVEAVPLTYVIGKDGVVANILVPPEKMLSDRVLFDELKALLEAKAEAKPADKTEKKDGKEPEKEESKP